MALPSCMPAKRVNVVSVRLVRDATVLYAPRSLSSPAQAADFFRQFVGDSDREQFAVACVNAKNEVNSIEIVSTGTLSSALVHPRETFKAAILSNAHAVILCHNHPSGDPSPSREDREITRRLVEAGKLLGIEVLDHVIIGDQQRYVSFRERGFLT